MQKTQTFPGVMVLGNIKVYIVDDHEVVRLGLRGLFDRYGGLDVVGEAATGEAAVQEAPLLRPDVIIMDVRLPGINGVEACRLIRAVLPETKVLMLSSFAEAEELQAAFTAGAAGYILKNITSGNLIHGIKCVMEGETFVDPVITAQVMSLIRGPRFEDNKAGLTAREEEILLHVARGKTNREIAQALFLSESTIRNNVSKILAKLGLANRSQAAAYVARRDVIDDNRNKSE